MSFGLLPQTIETVHSRFNGEIKVKKYRDGSIALMADGSEQSGLYFDSLWTAIFKNLTDQKIFGDPKEILILGCGGGTQPKLLNGPLKSNPPRKITIVEIDPKIVEIAKKHFGLVENENQKILITDAFLAVKNFLQTGKKFDLVIVDLFIGENIPQKINHSEFLKTLSQIVSVNSLVIFNYSPKDKNMQKLNLFEKKLRQFFLIREELLPIKLNQIIICTPIQKNLPEKNYRQSKNYENFIKSFGWAVKKIDGVSVLIRHLPIFSFLTLIKVARPNKLFPVSKIDSLAKKNHALMIKFDPGNGPISVDDLRKHGYKKDKWSLLSTASVFLDLTLSIPKLFDQLSPQARRKIKKIENEFSKELIFKHFRRKNKEFSSAISEFILGWDKFSSRRKIYSSKDAHMDKLVESFGDVLERFWTRHQKTQETLWGLIIIKENKTAFYLHTFTSLAGREFSTSYWGVWKALPILKKLGLQKLDFEGIFDERFPKSRPDWIGLTQFKLDWGKPVFFPFFYVKYYNPLVKFLFSIFSAG